MTPRYEWGKKLEEQTLYKRPPRPQFLQEAFLDFPDPNSVQRSTTYEKTSKHENTVAYVRERHYEQRYRLLNRHAAEYKKWKADVEMSIDVETTFRQDIKPTQLGIGMLQQSYQIISSPNTKEALVRLPASKRNVLVSIEQLRQLEPPPEKLSESELEWSATEFAAEIARQAVEERRRMMVEEIDMRLFHAEAMDLYYTVMMRADPVKYPKGPTKNQPTQPPSKKPMTANMPSSAVPGQGVGYSASSGHSTSAIPSAQAGSPAVARDPRLERAQDPRLNPRR